MVAFDEKNTVYLSKESGGARYGDKEDTCFHKVLLQVPGQNQVIEVIASPRKLHCKFNDFKADFYKDELYVSMVIVNDGKLVKEYTLGEPVIPFRAEQ